MMIFSRPTLRSTPATAAGRSLISPARWSAINTAIIARGQGIGFAIPINIVKEVLLQLREAGSVSRGWIGVSIQSLTPELAEHFGIESDSGVLISAVTPGDPAEKAGIKGGRYSNRV